MASERSANRPTPKQHSPYSFIFITLKRVTARLFSYVDALSYHSKTTRRLPEQQLHSLTHNHPNPPHQRSSLLHELCGSWRGSHYNLSLERRRGRMLFCVSCLPADQTRFFEWRSIP